MPTITAPPSKSVSHRAVIAASLAVPKPRIGTKPTRASRQRRLQGKRERGEVKRGRSSRDWD